MGETSSDSTILMMPPTFKTLKCVADPATAAPMMPPISACEELLGRAKYQVTRFQVMAASSADMTTTEVRDAWLATSLPIVLATLVLMNAPTKLRMAAMAMALAVS